MHHSVEHRCKAAPIDFRIGKALNLSHGMRIPLAALTSYSIPNVSSRHSVGRSVKPSDQCGMSGQTRGLTSQLDEDRLCDIGCGGRITLDLS
jgi:hypothetical protein